MARAGRGSPRGAGAGALGTAGDRGGARDRSAGVADASDSGAAPSAAPRAVAARGPGAQVRRRDPVLSCLVFELSQCIFFARCLAIVPLWARALRNDSVIGLRPYLFVC